MFYRSLLHCGFIAGILCLSGCSLDNELYQDHFSRDIEDTPKLANLLMDKGILGAEGALRIFWINPDGNKIELDNHPLPDHGDSVALWSWQVTRGFYLQPDRVRDHIRGLSKDHPPDALLLPGSLGPFLIDLYHATQD